MIEVLMILFPIGIVVLVVAIVKLFKKRYKQAGLIVVGYVVLGLLIFVASGWYKYKACGPNPKDVAIMKPMAEKISEYIVQNGVPKSLKDIPGLPYKIYQKDGEDKSFYHFEANGFLYTIFNNGDVIQIESNRKRGNGYTWAWIFFKVDNNSGKYIQKKIEYSLAHGSGICSTWGA